MYCQVIVDIVHENVASPFTYRIPDMMTLEPGQRVAVPFGPREKEGIVEVGEGGVEVLADLGVGGDAPCEEQRGQPGREIFEGRSGLNAALNETGVVHNCSFLSIVVLLAGL